MKNVTAGPPQRVLRFKRHDINWNAHDGNGNRINFNGRTVKYRSSTKAYCFVTRIVQTYIYIYILYK